MTIEEYRNKWNDSGSTDTFELFLFNELMKTKSLLSESIDAIYALAFKIESWISNDKEWMSASQIDRSGCGIKKDNSTTTKVDTIKKNAEERMFGKIVCSGLCEKCHNRDGRTCLIASRFGIAKPSSKQIKYAESIAASLGIALPLCKKKIPYGSFISSTKDDFAVYQSTRVWQKDF